MKRWFNISFYDAGSDYIMELVRFHEFLIVILVYILIVVGFIIVIRIFNKFVNLEIIEHQQMEFFWTIFPGLILVAIAIPSIRLLYIFDEENSNHYGCRVKVCGYQWYWGYEHEIKSNFLRIIYTLILNSKEFHYIKSDLEQVLILDAADYFSYIVTLKPKHLEEWADLRLLEVIGELIVPKRVQVEVIVSSEDVLHSWTFPRIGIKVDAIPGRLNKVSFIPIREGYYYGQCSEICGAYHRYIPTILEITDFS